MVAEAQPCAQGATPTRVSCRPARSTTATSMEGGLEGGLPRGGKGHARYQRTSCLRRATVHERKVCPMRYQRACSLVVGTALLASVTAATTSRAQVSPVVRTIAVGRA